MSSKELESEIRIGPVTVAGESFTPPSSTELLTYLEYDLFPQRLKHLFIPVIEMALKLGDYHPKLIREIPNYFSRFATNGQLLPPSYLRYYRFNQEDIQPKSNLINGFSVRSFTNTNRYSLFFISGSKEGRSVYQGGLHSALYLDHAEVQNYAHEQDWQSGLALALLETMHAGFKAESGIPSFTFPEDFDFFQADEIIQPIPIPKAESEQLKIKAD